MLHGLKNESGRQFLVLVYSAFLPSALLNNFEKFHFYDWLDYSVTE